MKQEQQDTKKMLIRIKELSLIHKCRSSLSFTNRVKGSKPLVAYLIANKLLIKDNKGCYNLIVRSFPNKLINTIENELKNFVVSSTVEQKQKAMFQVENVPLSMLTTDNKAVTELSRVMMSLPKDKVSSVLIGLHVCNTKKAASNLFLACKRSLNDRGFVSKTILNEAKVYQGTRIWRKA